ncbi:unnamed protein product [Camellia sinensis]
MANQQQISTRPWILEAVPLMVVVLIAAHVLALLLRSSLREERSTRTSSIYSNREVMDELTINIQDDVPWCMLFADDIVLVDETREGVNTKLEIWRKVLESKGFWISRTKTEYMECKFSNSNNENRGEVKIENQELPKSEQFRYLGSIITSVIKGEPKRSPKR